MRRVLMMVVCGWSSHACSIDQAPLVDVQTLLPDMHVEMRYAGSHNFVGTRIDGYHAPRCLLLPDVADALVRVEKQLRQTDHRLVIFDCYRPRRAVAHFMRWAKDLDDERSKAEFYPRIEKSTLVPDYIAEESGHSRADTVDVGLMRCTGGSASCVPLDMGTAFDLFDTRAHTESAEVSVEQRANRHRLLEGMARQGFTNYALEWWHFSLNKGGATSQSFDIPIEDPATP